MMAHTNDKGQNQDDSQGVILPDLHRDKSGEDVPSMILTKKKSKKKTKVASTSPHAKYSSQ